MTPQEELNDLRCYIKLTKEQAEKRDLLEGFLSNPNKCLYIDADSILYKVAHYGYQEGKHVAEMYEDYQAQVREINNTIEDEQLYIDYYVHFFSTCSKNFRYDIDKDYKANRERNDFTKFVKELKWKFIGILEYEGELTKYSDIYEADDLIAEAVRLNENHSPIVASIDKDLKQIPCCHFDYYKKKVGVDEFGGDIRAFKGFSYTTPQEGYEMLLEMLLIGDTSDNIKGVKGIGKVKAKKLLKERNNFGKLRAVVEAYGDSKRLRNNIKLMKL